MSPPPGAGSVLCPQRGCSAGKGLLPKWQKAGRPQGCPCACPAPARPWCCQGCGSPFAEGFAREGAPRCPRPAQRQKQKVPKVTRERWCCAGNSIVGARVPPTVASASLHAWRGHDISVGFGPALQYLPKGWFSAPAPMLSCIRDPSNRGGGVCSMGAL